MMTKACLVSFLAALMACAGSGGGDDGAVDAPLPIDAGVDAVVDAAVDAAIDAAPVACALPPMTSEVATVAGCPGAAMIDGVRGMARFANPVNVLVGPTGMVYVADFDNARVRTVTADGTVATLVAQARFQRPFGLAMVGAELFVSTDDNDLGQHSPTTGTVWRVSLTTGVAVAVARDLGRPRGLAALPDGRLVLADYVHHVVSLLDPTTGQVTALAGARDQAGYVDGTGAAARFDGAYDVAVLPDGRIAVSDFNNHRVRAVTLAGVVTTLAGTGTAGHADGAAATATFGHPQALASDVGGRLYITDTDGFTIRRLAGGEVTTIAGAGVGGWKDGPRLEAQFWGLEGLALTADGTTAWVADGSRGEDVPYNHVRRVELP